MLGEKIYCLPDIPLDAAPSNRKRFQALYGADDLPCKVHHETYSDKVLAQVKYNQLALIRFRFQLRNPSHFVSMGQGPEALQWKPGIYKGFHVPLRWWMQVYRLVLSLPFLVPHPGFVFPSMFLLNMLLFFYFAGY